MSENKLPEGLKEERDQKISDAAASHVDLYANGYAEGIDDGVELFASYIAKQEPYGYEVVYGQKLREYYPNDERWARINNEWHKDDVVIPLYTHPSHLESENKRLRDALEEIRIQSTLVGVEGNGMLSTDLQVINTIATNAINK